MSSCDNSDPGTQATFSQEQSEDLQQQWQQFCTTKLDWNSLFNQVKQENLIQNQQIQQKGESYSEQMRLELSREAENKYQQNIQKNGKQQLQFQQISTSNEEFSFISANNNKNVQQMSVNLCMESTQISQKSQANEFSSEQDLEYEKLICELTQIQSCSNQSNVDNQDGILRQVSSNQNQEQFLNCDEDQLVLKQCPVDDEYEDLVDLLLCPSLNLRDQNINSVSNSNNQIKLENKGQVNNYISPNVGSGGTCISDENDSQKNSSQNQQDNKFSKLSESEEKNQQFLKNSCDVTVDVESLTQNDIEMDLLLDQLIFKPPENCVEKICIQPNQVSNTQFTSIEDSQAQVSTESDQSADSKIEGNVEESIEVEATQQIKPVPSWPDLNEVQTDFWNGFENDGWGSFVADASASRNSPSPDHKCDSQNSTRESDLQTKQSHASKTNSNSVSSRQARKFFLRRMFRSSNLSIDQIQSIYSSERSKAAVFEHQVAELKNLQKQALIEQNNTGVLEFHKLIQEQTAIAQFQHQQAAKNICARINQDIQTLDCLDLHGLYTFEALHKLDEYLFLVKDMVVCLGSQRHVLIITGAGNNSANGEAQIKQAVSKKLTDEEYIFYPENEGSFVVVVNPNNQNQN